MRIKSIIEFPGKLPKPTLTLFGLLMVLAIGGLDTITSYDISISVLYLLPIILIAWYEGGVPASLISIFSAITWATSDLVSGHLYSHITIRIWNTVMVLAMYLFVAYSVTTVKKLFLKEHEHADTDELTGVANIKFFYEQARNEISRSIAHKQPLTLACVDVNNMRYVNDTFGHIAGDYLLHEAAQIMRSTLRSSAIISRLGGAKFAILLPETPNENATVAINNVQEHLLAAVKKKSWPVTFSAGVVTCDGSVCTLDELIAKAEARMNTVRDAGLDAVTENV